MDSTAADLQAQWVSPSDVTSILMIIGGDVVQKALAQGTGKLYTPVCFSFGCVAYGFVSLANIIGDGRLLPPVDYPAKLFNLESGYHRENKNWVVGRILRDLESAVSRSDPLGDNGIRISVFEATLNSNGPTSFSWGWIHIAGILITSLQLALASIPIALYREWAVMMILVAGTLLVQITGWIPQWRAEKLPNRQRSNAMYALTSGNGSRDVIVILGRGYCLDLEEMCAAGSPRTSRPWEKFRHLSEQKTTYEGRKELPRRDTRLRKSINAHGMPVGFWITRFVGGTLSVCWLLLLVNVAAAKRHTWYLLGIGAIGMFQNTWLAATERHSERYNLPLHPIDTIKTRKVMDGLMDFETVYKTGRPLLEEFFPGKLRPLEEQWWNGTGDEAKDAYDDEREKNGLARGKPKRRQKDRLQPSPALFKNHPSFVRDENRSPQDDKASMVRSDAHVAANEKSLQPEGLTTMNPAHMPPREMPPMDQILRQASPSTTAEHARPWPRYAVYGGADIESSAYEFHQPTAAQEYASTVSSDWLSASSLDAARRPGIAPDWHVPR